MKESLKLYALFVGAGLLAGGLFSKAQYHKGQADAYDEISWKLKFLTDKIQKEVDEYKEEA